MPTIQQLQDFANGPTGQTLLHAGQAVQQGADPVAVAAGVAQQMAAGSGQSVQDFLSSQGGAMLSQYIGAVAGGESPGDAFGAALPAAFAVGATIGLGALGVPPPISTFLGTAVGNFIGPILQDIIHGPIDQTYSVLQGDFAWRGRKYHTKCLPQAFVTWMEGNGYSLSKAILNPPSGESPPWAGLSMAMAQWLLQGGFGGRILLPGYTDAGSGWVYQLGIPYSLPRDAGDGWNVPSNGWWWYPSNETMSGPLVDLYTSAGIDYAATLANVKAKNDASLSNVVYKPIAYTVAADQLEDALNKGDAHRTRLDNTLIQAAGGEKKAGAMVPALLGVAALLLK